MSAIQSKRQAVGVSSLNARMFSLGTSAAAKVLELGVTLADAEAGAAIPGLCSQCWRPRKAHGSTSQFSNIFCSEECEQEFIRAALASITVEDCLRIQHKLESLLTRTEAGVLEALADEV